MKRRTIIWAAALACCILSFTFVPLVHVGAVGPVPYDTHPSNYVYESLSCRTLGLGTTFWGDNYELACGVLILSHR